jgi:hypothetical protein
VTLTDVEVKLGVALSHSSVEGQQVWAGGTSKSIQDVGTHALYQVARHESSALRFVALDPTWEDVSSAVRVESMHDSIVDSSLQAGTTTPTSHLAVLMSSAMNRA